MCQQEKPDDFRNDCAALCHYAKTFFGFGNWKADFWLIGLEEFSWAKETNEFKNRYCAWKKMRKAELVNLSAFFRDAKIKDTPDWSNQTWHAIHCLCEWTGLKIGELSKTNKRWGGTRKVRPNSRHLALIEALPFPAPSLGQWPYNNKDWRRFRFMQSRKKCRSRFFLERLEKLLNRLFTYGPKLVIVYGKMEKIEMEEFERITGIKWNHEPTARFDWMRVGSSASSKMSLLCHIDHPNYLVRFRGGCPAIKKVANRIKRLLKNRVAVRRG